MTPEQLILERTKLVDMQRAEMRKLPGTRNDIYLREWRSRIREITKLLRAHEDKAGIITPSAGPKNRA